MAKRTKFEEWVLANYTGEYQTEPPADWDRKHEFFYLIDGKQYRINYYDVPAEFLLDGEA